MIMSTNSASNHQQHQLGQDESLIDNENFLASRGSFPHYDPAVLNGQRDDLAHANWGFGTGSIDDSSMQPLYQSWPPHVHQQQQVFNFPSSNGAAQASKNDIYAPSSFDGTLSGPFQNLQYNSSSVYHTAEGQPSTFANAGVSIVDQPYRQPPSSSSYANPSSASTPAAVEPVALQQNGSLSLPQHAEKSASLNKQAPLDAKSNTIIPMPGGSSAGKFVVTSEKSLSSVVKCQHLRSFLSVGDTAVDVIITKSTIPAYIPRKSRNEIKRLLASDSRYSATVAKKPAKKGKAVTATAAATVPSKALPVASTATSPATSNKIPDSKVPVKTSESSDDASSSDEGSSSDSDDDETMSAPLPPVRPTNPIEAVKYDTVKKLWRVPYRSATADDIRQGLADFWDIVRTIRDRWKSDSAAVKQAEETKKDNEIPFLKERVTDQRNKLEAVLKAAIADGHKDIVEHFGENLQFILALAIFLQDRAREGDYNGSFPRTVLELLSKCKTLTEAALEKTNVSKVLPRFSKRGDEATKRFSKTITDNASAASKKRKELLKSTNAASAQTKDTKSSSEKNVASITGVKRARPSEGSSSQPAKKVAADNPSDSDGKPKRVISANGVVKPMVSATGAAAKPKALQVVAKPSGFFSSLQPALRKPGASTSTAVGSVNAGPKASSQTAAISSTEKKPASIPAQGAAKPAFSFAATMASLNKPSEPVEAASKSEEPVPSETPEERAKRLRKEERRKLRVSFKPDSALTEIKYFIHDPEEEQGHDASQMRDVGDVESEGRMFKLKHQEGGDMMDLDDSDEDEQMTDIDDLTDTSRPYPAPVLIDFDDVPSSERERVYAPYGGGALKPDCPERFIQERRESNTLMAVYSDPSDIPPSPKEPVNEESDNADTVKEFGALPAMVDQRLKSFISSQIEEPRSNFLPAATAAKPAPIISQSQLSALLGSLPPSLTGSQPTITSQAPSQQQTASMASQSSQPAFSDLEKIFAQFSQPGSQAQPQQTLQSYQSPPPPPSQPNILAAFPGLQGLLSSATGSTPTPPQTNLSMTASPPRPAQPATGTPDISSILASLQQAGVGQLPTFQKPSTAFPDLSKLSIPGFPNLGQQLAQQQQQDQQKQQDHYPYENEERRRWREAAEAEDEEDEEEYDPNYDALQTGNGNKRRQQWGGNNAGKKNKFGNEGRYSPPKFVVQCKYYMEGKCKKGDDCTFRHDDI